MKDRPKELPPDKIVVQTGQVISLEEWTNWNGEHVVTMTATRDLQTGECIVQPCDPEHGGSPTGRGKTMSEAAGQVLHPDIASKLAAIFALPHPQEHQIRQLHYRKGKGLQVVFQ